MQRNRLVAIAAVCFTLLAANGCRKSVPSGAYSSIDPATAGTVNGVIDFDGPAPKRIAIDMAQDPACAMSGTPNLTEGTIVNNGKLANVFVYVSSGLGNKLYPPSGNAVILDQKGCRYIPHVIAAQVGQPIEFRNSDATMHNIHMEPTVGGNQAVDISQPPNGGTTRHAFAKAETMIPVRCNNHPWMQAYINIADSPFFAVSDDTGKFSIHGLPPGVYTLTAVHEQLGSRQETITVTEYGVVQSEFHFAATGK